MHGELQKPGIAVSQSTVTKYMRGIRARPHKRDEHF
jgi:arginine repressor